MIYRIRHITEYIYSTAVTQCFNQAHILPRNTHNQQCQTSLVNIQPKPDYLSERNDYFENRYCYFSLSTPHTHLVVDITSEIHTGTSTNSQDLDLGNSCARARQLLQSATDSETLAAREFLLDSPMISANPELRAFAEPIFNDDIPLLSAVRELCHKIYSEFKYDPHSTTIATPLDEVIRNRSGVCQDFAHLAIGCLRALGFPARYISGYLETLPPPGEEKLIGADASHAWFAVYSPEEGWFDFDPTNNNIPADQHITTAWGRDYSDVTPIRGVIFGGGETQALEVSVNVERLA